MSNLSVKDFIVSVKSEHFETQFQASPNVGLAESRADGIQNALVQSVDLRNPETHEP